MIETVDRRPQTVDRKIAGLVFRVYCLRSIVYSHLPLTSQMIGRYTCNKSLTILEVNKAMEITDAIVELAYAIRRAVRPHLGREGSKVSAGMTSSGDVEFEIDEVAERAIEEFIHKHKLEIATTPRAEDL